MAKLVVALLIALVIVGANAAPENFVESSGVAGQDVMRNEGVVLPPKDLYSNGGPRGGGGIGRKALFSSVAGSGRKLLFVRQGR